MLEFLILGMVTNEDLTGYDIKKYIENGIGVFYKASFGSIYPMLKKLMDKGCLVMYQKPQGSRQKNYYQITSEGKRITVLLSFPLLKYSEYVLTVYRPPQ